MKKVAFFVTSLNSGGIENYLLRFLQFSNHKIEATVYCKSGNLGVLESEYLKAGAKLKPFKVGVLSLIDFFQLYEDLKYENYDVVVDFTGNFAAIPLLIGKKTGVEKRIAFYRGSTNHFKETKLRLLYNQLVKKITYVYATDILSNSRAAFNFFFPKNLKQDKRFRVIYNGINHKVFINNLGDLREEFNIPKEAFVVGHTGRFNKAKNHEAILNVAIRLCEKYDDIYFFICGNKVKDNLYYKIKEKKLQHKIIVQNNRMDISKVLNTLDCYYFPSITEGQPNALIEAMVSGLPIVASNISPNKETVPKFMHSWLVSPHDTTAAINNILKIYRGEDTNVKRMKEWAIKRFNHVKLFQEFLDVITQKI